MADQITPVPDWPGELVALDAGEVFVRTAVPAAGAAPPDAAPAVFVHGLGGSARNWTDLMDLLSRPGPRPGDPVIPGEAIDLPGFGFSPPPPDGNYTLDARAAAVAALIDARGRWPVHLVGNSLGGAVCVRLAARRPDLVRTLTLISPALPDLRPRVGPLRVSLMGLPVLGGWVLGRIAAFPAEQRTAATVAELFADPRRMDPVRYQEEVAEVARRDGLGYQTEVLLGSARAIVTEYLRFGPRSLWRDAARVTAPALVIHGSNDRLVNPVMAARAARVFRSASAVVLPQTGHVAMMERPATVARLMREFFAAGTLTAVTVAAAGTAGGSGASGREAAGTAQAGSDQSGQPARLPG
jgi:pimeloyl-ACP methyl ester carboxylesterase